MREGGTAPGGQSQQALPPPHAFRSPQQHAYAVGQRTSSTSVSACRRKACRFRITFNAKTESAGVRTLRTCPKVPRPKWPKISRRSPLGVPIMSETATIKSPSSLSAPLREGEEIKVKWWAQNWREEAGAWVPCIDEAELRGTARACAVRGAAEILRRAARWRWEAGRGAR